MKNLIIFSMLTVMVVINFTGCGKAQERPAKVSNKISGTVIEMENLADITTTQGEDSQENIAFKRQLIGKIEDSKKRDEASLLLEQSRLTYMFMEGKIVLLEFIPATTNKHAVAVSTSATATVSPTDIAEEAANAEEVVDVTPLHTYESLVAMKEGRTDQVAALKVSTWSQNRFVVLAEIGMQTGILENERTEYNEKKSTLGLTETPLAQAKILILKSEITAATTADASGDSQ